MFGLQLSRLGAAISAAYGYSPTSLFSSGEVGAWYDPSDLTTMFQDRAGTTPVTADGQTVGKILDKSGNGNHATAPSDAARPLYKTDGTYHWLQFDGVDDSLMTAAVDLSGTDKVFVSIGGLRTSNGGGFVTTETASTGFAVLLPGSNGGFRADLKNTTKSTDALLVDTKAVYSVSFDAAGATATDEIKVRKNGVGVGTIADAGPTSGNQANQSLVIGNWFNALPLNGKSYSIIVLGRAATAAEITATETWVAAKTGVTL